MARITSRAFNDALTEAGGTLPTWLILLSVKRIGAETQSELARAVGIEGATLTHHLDALEADGLVSRTRHPDNRRAVRVRLTPEGEKLFERLYRAASDFDQRLRQGVSDDEVGLAHDILTRFRPQRGERGPRSA